MLELPTRQKQLAYAISPGVYLQDFGFFSLEWQTFFTRTVNLDYKAKLSLNPPL